MRYSLLLPLLIMTLLLTKETTAQLNTSHFIPPFYAHNDGSTTAQEQVLYLSSPHQKANYTISDGAGNILKTGSFSRGQFDSLYHVGYNTPFACDESELNTPLTNKGYIITSDSAIYVNLRVNAGSFSSPAQGGSLTSKGYDALGTTYRLGHIPSSFTHNRKCSGYSIMATENNTSVTINFKKKDLTLRGAGAPSTSTPLTINLNKGESYVAAIHTADPNNLDTGLIGSLITSNRPIAVNSGSWAGSFGSTNSGADIGIDQIVDLTLVGDQYVLVRGQGKNADDDENEQVLVVAHHDSTFIFANGSTTAIDTLMAGEYSLMDGSFYINEVMFLTTSEPSYVYQIILGADNTNNTQGMNFVPPITCYTAQEIDMIPTVDSIGTKKYSGGISVVTKKGSNILINGAPPSVLPVEALGSNYEAYKIEGLTGNIVVSTNSIALVGFFGFSGAAGYGGYYSGFDRVEFTSNVIEECPPGVLYSSSNLKGSYQWHKDGLSITGENSDTLSFKDPGEYYVVFTKEQCKDTSSTIKIIPNPISLVQFFSICEGTDTAIYNRNDENLSTFWFGTETANPLIIDSAGTYWAVIRNEKNCETTDSLIVTAENCGQKLTMPTVFSPNGSGSNDLFIPIENLNVISAELAIYNRWGKKIDATNDLSKGWDGKNKNGRKAATGVYYWTIKYTSQTLIESKNHFINGFVQLL